MRGVAGEVEEEVGVDVQVDAQFVLDCGNPFVQHVPMLPDACSGGGDVVPGVAVEGRDGIGHAGEFQRGGQPAQRQADEAAVFEGERAQLPAQRRRPVRGHERLVPAAGVGEQRALGAARPQGAEKTP